MVHSHRTNIQVPVAMKIATFLLVAAVCMKTAHSRLVEVPFGTTDSTASPSDLLHRRDSAVNFNSLSFIRDKLPTSEPYVVQVARITWDPTNIADDASWQKYKKKGNWLRCLMEMPDEVAGREWPNYLSRSPASARSQWQETLEGCDFDDDVEESSAAKNRIGLALTALGLSLKPVERCGKNVCHSVEHFDENGEEDEEGDLILEEQDYVVDGKVYPNTGAYNRFAFNAEQGAIFGHDFLSPHSAGLDKLGEKIPNDELPALHQASDIIAAYWLRNDNPRNLRYWFGSDIVNTESVPVITRILVDRGYTEGIPFWPGVQVDAPSEEYLVLLGTLFGASKGFFLTQHKAELGIKHGPSITIFRDAKDPRADHAPPEIQLLFRIEDVPQEDISPDDMEVVDEGAAGPSTQERVKKRRDSMLGLDLERNISRVHVMSFDGWGETVLHSHEFKKKL